MTTSKFFTVDLSNFWPTYQTKHKKNPIKTQAKVKIGNIKRTKLKKKKEISDNF